MSPCFRIAKEAKNETPFMKGRILLQELIASCNGKSNPIHSFTPKELQKATKNYRRKQIISEDGDYVLYRGVINGRPVTVKRYRELSLEHKLLGSPVTDIMIGSQMSVHKNVLKLIGCCLDTELPILVYEFAGNETLSKYIYCADKSRPDDLLLSWKRRTRVAAEIADALAYLHTSLSRPVIHRDTTARNIILDKNHVVKLLDFSLCISIPDGQAHAEDIVRGRMQFMAPEYMGTGFVTEKVDVYGFGILLLEILIGRRIVHHEHRNLVYVSLDRVVYYIENKRLIEIVHPKILVQETEQQDLLTLGALARSCIRREADDRPTMVDVAKEVKKISERVPPYC